MTIYDVFISYRRSDGAELAKKLYDYLTEKDLRVFLDKEEMITGKYFDEQIRQNVINTPNYIFIGTPDAFKFRSGETDFVAEEIKLAVSEYDKAPTDRVVLPVLPAGSMFPDKSAFPKGTDKLAMFDAVLLSGSEPNDEEYLKILKAVSSVSKRNLWNAGHRWLENSKKRGGRFATLDIDATIMPKASRRGKSVFTQMPINVFRKEKDGEGHETTTEEQPLLKALDESKGHLYLIGQGGIGKTTALISVMNDAYDGKTYSEDKPVPLFVELSNAPDTYGKLYEGGISTFIRREICRQIRSDRSVKQVSKSGVGKLDEVFKQSPETAVEPVDELLTKETASPEYLLLLDGLNETSRADIPEADRPVVTMIIREIEWIIDNCPNVRVILTSRTDDTALSNDKISRLYLTGVEDETIRSYLENKKLSRKRIEAAFADKNLIETIRIPLFLTMYASLKNAEEVSTQGEIFRMFFSERRSNIETYTAQGRAAEAEEGISSQKSKKRVTADMQSFILDFVMPEIAWTMEREGKFYLDGVEIEDIIAPVLTEETPDRVCGRYGREVFARINEGSKIHTREIAKKMRSKLGNEMIEVSDAVRDCLVYSLCIMQEGTEGYGFMHHHIRDYFAAVRNINSLRMAVYSYEHNKPDEAKICLSAFITQPISFEVRRLIGEYLHEHRNASLLNGNIWKYNVPEKPEDRNLIKRALNIFRGAFDDNIGYAVFNFIEILKYSRGELCGEDFSSIDFSKCSLNGITLGRDNCGSLFRNSIISESNLFPVGHRGKVSTIQFSYDGCWLMTLSEDNRIKIWDTNTFVLCFTIENAYKASFGNKNNTIVSTDGKKVHIWSFNGDKIELFGTLSDKHYGIITDVSFSCDDTKLLVSSGDRCVTVWNVSDLSHITTLVGHTSPVIEASFSEEDRYIISHSIDKEVIVWNAKTYENEQLLTNLSSGSIIHLIVCNNGFFYLSTDKAVSFYDLNSKKSNLVFEAAFVINDIALSDDKTTLLLALSNKTTVIYFIKEETVKSILEGHYREITSVAIGGHKNKWIATGSSDHTISIWNASTFSRERVIGNYSDMMIDAVYSPDAKYIVTASRDNSIGVWLRYGNYAKIIRLPAHSSQVNSVTISPEVSLLASASEDCTIKLWDMNTYELRKTLNGHTSGVTSVAFSPNMKTIASSSKDRTIRVWDLKTGSLIKTLEYHMSTVSSVVYSPDARWIAASSYDGQISIWNAKTFLLVSKIQIENTWINSICFSPDGTRLMVASGDKLIRIYDVNSISLLCSIISHKSSISKIIFSPNMKYIVSASWDGTIKFFDSETFAMLKCTEFHEAVVSVDFCPDMTCYLVVLADGSVFEYNLDEIIKHELNPDYFTYGESRKIVTQFDSDCAFDDYVFDDSGIVYIKRNRLSDFYIESSREKDLGKLIGHTDKVMSIYYSGSNYYLTASKDNTAILWDSTNYSIIGRFIGHTNTVRAAILSSDERYAITQSDDGTTKIWDVSTFQCINSITHVKGLYVTDCDFRHLHELSTLSEEDKKILREYGAIV